MSTARSLGSGVVVDAVAVARPRADAPGARLAVMDPRVTAALSGDREAATSLVRELLPRVRNLVRFLLHGDADVEDVAQDAVLAILHALPGFRGESAFETWYERIVVRLALKHARRGRRLLREPLDALESHDRAQGQLGTADLYVARRALARMLDDMPAEQREALVLHHVVGMSAPEVARTLGVPFETVRSRVRLGMIKLRGYFGLGSASDD